MADHDRYDPANDRRHYAGGNQPVLSTNDAIRYAILLVAIVTFAITVKNNQDASNERQARLERRIDGLADKMDQMNADMNEWKRATTGLLFSPRSKRAVD